MNKKQLYRDALASHVQFDYYDYMNRGDAASLRAYNGNMQYTSTRGAFNVRRVLPLQENNFRARVYECDNNVDLLESYSTIVASYDGAFRKHWQGYSATTMKHINIFRAWYGLPSLSKHDWVMLPVE